MWIQVFITVLFSLLFWVWNALKTNNRKHKMTCTRTFTVTLLIAANDRNGSKHLSAPEWTSNGPSWVDLHRTLPRPAGGAEAARVSGTVKDQYARSKVTNIFYSVVYLPLNLFMFCFTAHLNHGAIVSPSIKKKCSLPLVFTEKPCPLLPFSVFEHFMETRMQEQSHFPLNCLRKNEGHLQQQELALYLPL